MCPIVLKSCDIKDCEWIGKKDGEWFCVIDLDEVRKPAYCPYMKDMYGHTTDGTKVEAPKGWRILPEGTDVPQAHREYLEDYTDNRSWWCDPRRCRSTMTAIYACIWGGVRAYAVPETISSDEVDKPKKFTPL